MDVNYKDDLAWVEKYRPDTIEECILPARIKKHFEEFRNQKKFPNLLLTGGPGLGKTTIAKAMINDLDMDCIFINASDERNIDVVRDRIKSFAAMQSLEGKKKAVILDEADGLNPTSAQPALRAAMEEFSDTRFILTCNYKNKILPAIHSRTSTVEFNLLPNEKEDMMIQFLKRVFEILTLEKVTFNKKVVASLVTKYYPDNRRILNELEHYAIGGNIDEGILTHARGANIDSLRNAMIEKNLTEIRQWVANNADLDPSTLYRDIYDNFYPSVTNETKPLLILHIGKYQYQAAMVADQEINTLCLLMEIIKDVEFLGK